MKKSILLFGSLLLTLVIFAQPPQKMSYQTVIRNATDDLVSNTAVGIQISVLQGSPAGTVVYVETHAPTTNSNGLTSLEIGDGAAVTGTFAAIDWGSGPYFVKSEVDPDGGTDYSLSIVNELLSVPYALHAGDDGDWAVTNDALSTDKLVGIGTSNPTARLDVNGVGEKGIYARTDLSTGIAIEALNTSTTGDAFGIEATSNSSLGTGVVGIGPKTGVYGFASAANASGRGVRGRATGSNAQGVRGEATGSSGVGVYGTSSSSSGIAIVAYSSSNSGSTTGLDVTVNSPDGTGIVAIGPKTGVYGFSSAANSDGRGLRGRATGGTGQGVRGEATGESGKALYGEATGEFGKGVHAKITSTHSSANAILAEWGGGSSYSGYFVGRVHVAGVLSKSSGSFKIDHPLDPENKYLSHSFVESPDMMNIYNGNVTTDEHGNALVELPDYFEALNMDFRYQLTVMGQFAQAIISKEIDGNSFEIKTDKPDVKVSWLVTGVRNDAFARQNRIQVEEEKEAANIGKYLNPESFGDNASRVDLSQ